MELLARISIDGEPDILSALEVLLRVNVSQMRASSFPSVYELGTHYEREPLGREWWVSARRMRADPLRGYDCEDLATYQVAWLLTTGADPGAKVGLKRSPAGWHVIVVRGDGTIEDPSRELGM